MDLELYIDNLIEISNSININEVTILTGRNAGGKSLIRRLVRESVSEKLGKKKVLIPHASQELRTGSNPAMGALSGATNDSDWLATSDCTLNIIEHVFKTKDADYIVIDEPEIGLGEELQLGMIDFLNEKIKESGKGVLIITHSKVTALGLRHDNFINLEGMSFDEWICRAPEKLSVDEFKKFAHDLFIAIRDRMANNRKKSGK